MTGFPPCVVELMRQRHNGICEVCGAAPVHEHHHRRARGAGGTRRPETNYASNGLGVCREDHRLIEGRRDLAMLLGWLVRSNADPAVTGCLYRGQWKYLDDNGLTEAA